MASSRRYRKGSGPERDEKPELKVQTRGYKLAKAASSQRTEEMIIGHNAVSIQQVMKNGWEREAKYLDPTSLLQV
uniref:Uncharacterized protein n=1 Tax=Oryza meridionalis TaxID=40149 RepID=A0A0E0CK16_9ORYZ